MAFQSFIANGTINPCRFVKLTTTTTGRVTQCGAGDQVYGVSQVGTRRSPYVDTSGNAAQVGEPVGVFDDGEECLLEVAAGTVLAGDRLKADANGRGVTTTTDRDEYGAIALQTSTAANDQIKVKVRTGAKIG